MSQFGPEVGFGMANDDTKKTFLPYETSLLDHLLSQGLPEVVT